MKPCTFIAAIISLFALVAPVAAWTTDSLFVNHYKNFYRDDTIQALNDEIYNRLLNNKAINRFLAQPGKWQIPQNAAIYSEQEIARLKKEQYLDVARSLVVTNRIEYQKNRNAFDIVTTIYSFASKREIVINYSINKYFVDLFVDKKSSIYFDVFIKAYFSAVEKTSGSQALGFQPYEHCEVSDYTSRGGRLRDLGIDCNVRYYCGAKETFAFPAFYDKDEDKLALPFEDYTIKDFIFRSLLLTQARYLNPQLKKHIAALLDSHNLSFRTFNTTDPEKEFYVVYKIKLTPERNQALIYAELFYRANLEKKTAFSPEEIKRFQADAVLSAYNDGMRANLLDLNPYVRTKNGVGENGVPQTIMILDTGELYSRLDRPSRSYALKKLGAIAFNVNVLDLLNKLFSRSEAALELVGYGSSQWRLNARNQLIMDKLIELIKNQQAGKAANLKIAVTGYTDSDPVRSPIENALHERETVYYSKCGSSRQAFPVKPSGALDAPALQKDIADNCQLSTMRAYIIGFYLQKNLADAKVSYRGAGEISGGNKFYNRKARIEITRELK